VLRLLATAAVAVSVLAMNACDGTPRRADGSPLRAPDAAEAGWIREVKSIRVHPLTRFLPGSDPVALDVRVECFDVDDNGMRTVGTLRVQVGSGEAAEQVTLDLNDHAVNLRCWDAVTRTISVRVAAPQGFRREPGATLAVEAWLRLNADAELHASRQVACP
jgi:hypothetical protein